MIEGTTLKSHISEYTALFNDMEMIGIKTDDEDKAMVLLCSLHISYEGFKETIIHSRDSLTLEDVKNNLLIKSDIDLDSSKATNHENVELFIERGREKKRTQNYDRSRLKSRNKNLICNFNQNKGHIKANCFKLKEKQEINQKVPNEEANVVESESSDVLFVSDEKDKFEKNLVMDTGASQHMIPNREWFATYEPSDGGVLLGNDHLCKIAGVGTVRIKMHDCIICTLTGVKHIPDLIKNLISLGSLEDAACKFQSDGGVLKFLE
jgi:gag-polypeptide of LTR copia-type